VRPGRGEEPRGGLHRKGNARRASRGTQVAPRRGGRRRRRYRGVQALWLGPDALQFPRRQRRGLLRKTIMDVTKIPQTLPRQSATFDPYTMSEIRRAAA